MAYTDSEPVETELDLRGVWLHWPDSPEESIRSYPYGADQKDDGLDMMGEARYYAGREAPVMDYGEHSGQAFGVVIDIPHGSTYRADLADLEAFARGRRTVYYRDNRGRAAYGQVEDLKRKDMPWGTQVSFAFTVSHWDRELVS